MGVQKHKKEAEKTIGLIPVVVVTVSDTRTKKTDESGKIICKLIEQAGHEVVELSLVRDEKREIEQKLNECVERGDRCIIFTGGTGLSPRDVTLDVLEKHFQKKVDGFGELFRWLSFQEVGSAAMLSRAAAGIVQRSVVFALPGSPNAVRLAVSRLIIPELRHIISQLDKSGATTSTQ